VLTYATTDRNGYRHYKSDPAICRTCPLLASCTTITRHVWRDARERTDANRLTSWGKAIYKRRKETVSLRQVPKSNPRHLPMPPRRRRTEYQENRHGTHQGTKPKPGITGEPTRIAAKTQKQNPAKI
jgi:hypothetical protein